MSQLKNRLRMLAALLAALTILVCAVPATVFAASTGTSTEALETVSSYPYTTKTKVKVNLRSRRSTRSVLLKKIPAGAEITVKAVKGSWAEIEYKKYSGYVMTEYIVLKEVKKVKVTATPTPVPTLSPEEDAGGYKILQKGSSGAEVTALQEALIELGYLSGTADGNYGKQTAAAVKAFQKANGLTVDGAAGEETQKLLYAGKGKKAEVKATATPKPTAAVYVQTVSGTLRQGSTGSDVKTLQQKLIQLGYLKGTADGVFGKKTAAALVSFQKNNQLKADGIAGSKTLAKLDASSTSVTAVTAAATATPTPAQANNTGTIVGRPSASKVIYANWYTTVKAVCRQYPYATVYDYSTGISWQVHIFSLGAHADFEPLTANDTAKMLRAFGGNTWNPKPVWVIFADGSVYMASTHSNPHGTQHNKDNNFDGHACIHFPRTQEQVEAIGPDATGHQTMIDKGWAATQAMK